LFDSSKSIIQIDTFDSNALMESACRWTSVGVVDYLIKHRIYETTKFNPEESDSELPPIAFLGINEEKTLNDNKKILAQFRYMFNDLLDSDGNQLIHIFVLNNRIFQLHAILELDPNLANHQSRIGLRPLDLVAGQFNLQLDLIRFNAQHTLHGVARIGNISAAEEIILNDPSCVNYVNDFGESPLHVAAIFGQTKMIQVNGAL